MGGCNFRKALIERWPFLILLVLGVAISPAPADEEMTENEEPARDMNMKGGRPGKARRVTKKTKRGADKKKQQLASPFT